MFRILGGDPITASVPLCDSRSPFLDILLGGEELLSEAERVTVRNPLASKAARVPCRGLVRDLQWCAPGKDLRLLRSPLNGLEHPLGVLNALTLGRLVALLAFQLCENVGGKL